MKRIIAPAGTYQDPSRPPNDDESDASLSDGSSKRVKTTQSFESLYNSESLSDIILDVNSGQHVFHAHKMIVGLKSERLAALIASTTVVHPGRDTNDTSAVYDDLVNNTREGNNNNTVKHHETQSCAAYSKPAVYLRESPQCAAVFCRFLYFIYSGAVWLHRDYVLPLFQLAVKYGVAALAAHCETYVLQLLQKCQESPAAPSLAVESICDMCEEDDYRQDTRHTAFILLTQKFVELIKSDRWAHCKWSTVRDLLRADECPCDENVLLVAATDWMKRNRLQDRSQILDILASIRYPRLPRRVLYHLYTTASFKNFPQIQQLIEAAIRYHCFKEVPEARGDFTGCQYQARGSLEHRNSDNTQQKQFSSLHVEPETELDDLNHYDTLAETIQYCHSGGEDQTMSYHECRGESPPPISSYPRPFNAKLSQGQPHVLHRPVLSRHAHSSAIPDCPPISSQDSLVGAAASQMQCSSNPSEDSVSSIGQNSPRRCDRRGASTGVTGGVHPQV